ncbi:SecDF P1 head subdomain-containing protein [Actinophytocola sp.]|uniref:SecDF P1 head subdomain-containing protein n=1 Tax=Actinophytocola sp. TaxID=1872138 RepID=UPI002ECFED35
MRAVLLVLVLVLTACSSEVTGAPAKDDSPVVGPVTLVVPIELHPVLEKQEPSGTAPPPTASPSPTELPDPSGEALTLAEPIMTIERLDRAEVMLDQSQQWVLSLDLTDEDTATFAEWTADHVGERLAMVVDGEIIIAPEIQSAITGGAVQIAGNYTQDEIRDLLDKITGR